MKDVRKTVISVTIIAGLLIIADLLVGAVCDNAMYRLPNYDRDLAKDNYRLNRIDKDIVIIGSSRAQYHYVSTLLQDSINQYTGRKYSLYNAALSGKFVNSNSCAAESIVNRYTPKLLIFEINQSELYERDKPMTDLLYSAPHYRYNGIVRSYIDSLGWKEQMTMKCNMYRYNNLLYSVLFPRSHKGDTTGYIPLFKVMNLKKTVRQVNKQGTERKFDDYSLSNFTRVLKICQDRDVHLVVVSSPYYYPHNNNEYLRSLCEQYNIPYIERYNTDLFNNNPQYFKDSCHLNNDGAHVYTKLFFQDLKPYLEHLK